MRLRAPVQPGDHDGVVNSQRRYHQFATQQSSALKRLGDRVRLLADLGELAQDFRQIYRTDGRAGRQRVLDHLSAGFMVEIGEKGGGIQDAGCVFQSARRGLSSGFRSPFGNELIGEGSASCPHAVKASCLPNGLTGACQA
jgi:hypothetical protein